MKNVIGPPLAHSPPPVGNLFFFLAGALVQPSDGLDKHFRPDVEHKAVFQHAGTSGSLLQEERLEVRGAT